MEILMEKVSSPVRFASRNERSLLSSIVGGLISFAIFSLSFLVILSLVAYKNADPTRLIQPFSYTALCMSAFVFGFTSGKLRRKQGALVGLISGLLLTFILFAVSSAINVGASTTPLGMAVCLYLAVIALATIGGLAGTQQKHKKKRRRR